MQAPGNFCQALLRKRHIACFTGRYLEGGHRAIQNEIRVRGPGTCLYKASEGSLAASFVTLCLLPADMHGPG